MPSHRCSDEDPHRPSGRLRRRPSAGRYPWITHVAHLTYPAFDLKIWSIFHQSQIRKIAYASPFALAGSGRQAWPLRGHWLLGSSGRPFTSICSEQTDAPRRGSALPVLARGVRHPAPTRVWPVADVMCPSAHHKDQSGSSPSSGGAQTRQTEINTADYTTLSRFVARSSQSMS